jgi:Calcineurin-like phosphoesterase
VVDEAIWNCKEEEGAHLFNWCVSRRMMPYRMVLSRGGTVNADHAYKNGADVVVDSIAHLEQAHQTLTTRIGLPITSERLSPLERRKERLKALSGLVGPNVLTKRMDQHVSQIHRFQDQHTALMTMMMPQHEPHPQHETTIRVIHISDTHNLHEHIDLPGGDILVHTGDIAGNYIHKGHDISLVDQLQSFLEWLERVALPQYEKVIFIAGNHDTYLDPAKCTTALDYTRAMNLIADYTSKHASHLHYLCHSSISHRGLLIYGCPTTICRVEGRARVTVSNGFERTIQQRHEDWQAIPRDVDILLTHLPPAGIGLSHVQDSCPMLTNRVYAGRTGGRPKLHCFGHEHSQFGVAVHEGTILSNACQERLIRVDWNGGALPIVIDLGVGGD